VWLATPGRDLELPASPPASELLSGVLALGTVTVCTQCAARRSLTQEDLIEGVRIAGAAAFADEVLQPDAQALVY
jgi:predicted peroxiredoxin